MGTRWGALIGLGVTMGLLVVAIACVPLSGVASFAFAVFLTIFLIAPGVAFLRAAAFTLGHLLHGTPALYLADVPVVPGRLTAAAVRTARPLRADHWALRLQCYSPIGDLDHREELRELAASSGATPKAGATWRGELLFDHEFTPSGEPRFGAKGEALLPVLIEVPRQAFPSSEKRGRVVRWVLRVKASSFPVTLAADFDLPVFYAAEGDVEHLAAVG